MVIIFNNPFFSGLAYKFNADMIMKFYTVLSCRRILIFPKGNNADHLSMYLDVADAATLPYGWSRFAQFSLAVINRMNNKLTVKKGQISYLVYKRYELCV